jgi:hypothetical protein
MLYAEFDKNGAIVAVRNNPTEKDQEPISETELARFLADHDETGSYQSILTLLDSKIIRVLDDLIDLLVQKDIIMVTDLPEEAQRKIGERKRIRVRMKEGHELTVDDIL